MSDFTKYTEIENVDRDIFLHKLKNFELTHPKMRYVVQPKCDGCLEGNTILDTVEYGRITIAEIVDKKLNCHVKAVNHETNEIVFTKITNFSKKDSINNWYKLTLSDGKELYVTGNHKIYLPKLKCYRAVEELTEDDEFLIS